MHISLIITGTPQACWTSNFITRSCFCTVKYMNMQSWQESSIITIFLIYSPCELLNFAWWHFSRRGAYISYHSHTRIRHTGGLNGIFVNAESHLGGLVFLLVRTHPPTCAEKCLNLPWPAPDNIWRTTHCLALNDYQLQSRMCFCNELK